MTKDNSEQVSQLFDAIRDQRDAARAELIVWPVRLQDALLRAQETFEVFRADAESERDALRAEADALRETNEVLAAKLDDMIVVNGQALACSSYVRAEVERLAARLNDCREELFEIERDE